MGHLTRLGLHLASLFLILAITVGGTNPSSVAVLDHDGGAADGHTDVLRLLLTTLILILWLTNILAQLFHLALIYCTDVAERYFPTLVAQQQLDTLMAN